MGVNAAIAGGASARFIEICDFYKSNFYDPHYTKGLFFMEETKVNDCNG